jgi:hypothetical protein
MLFPSFSSSTSAELETFVSATLCSLLNYKIGKVGTIFAKFDNGFVIIFSRNSIPFSVDDVFELFTSFGALS